MTRETDPRWMNHLSEWEAHVVRTARQTKKDLQIEDMYDVIRHLAELLDTAHLPEVQGTFLPWPGESSHTIGNTHHTVGDIDLQISPMSDLHGEIKLTDEDELYLKPITYYKINPPSRNLSEVNPAQQMEPIERVKIEPALVRTYEAELYGPTPWGTYQPGNVPPGIGDWEHGVMEYTGTIASPEPDYGPDSTVGTWINPDGSRVDVSDRHVPSSTTTTFAKGTVVVDDGIDDENPASNEPHSDA